MAKLIRKPRDWSQRALSIVQQATGQITKRVKHAKNMTAAQSGQHGGMKGGKVRALRLSAKRRQQIARKAARSRWHESA